MTRTTYIYFILINLFTFSCANKERETFDRVNDKLIKKEFYESGEIKKLAYLNSDSIKDGKYYEFFKSGDTAKITLYRKGKKDSIETEFYPSGNLKSLRVWKMEHPWGEYIEYFDGIIETYFTLIEGDTFVVEEPRKKKYSVFNNYGEIGYMKSYDSTGNPLDEKGSSILFTKVDKVKIDVKDTISLQYYLATPDWVTRTFVINIRNEESIIVSTDTPTVNEEHNAVFYSRKFVTPGKYVINGISIFKDEISGLTKRDSTSLEILVTSDSKNI